MAYYSNSINRIVMKIFHGLCVPVVVTVGMWALVCSCNQGKPKEAEAEIAQVVAPITLIDKSLPEVKQLVDGRWALLMGKNATQECEFENTFITFNGDKYIWTEDGVDEPGDLNWRNAADGTTAWLMDVFYTTHPSYPLELRGDTLYIKDVSETNYLYTLIRKKK